MRPQAHIHEAGSARTGHDAAPLRRALASGNRLVLLRFFMLTGLLHMLSLVLCCPGLILSRAVIDFGETEAFLLATRDDTPQCPFIAELGL